MKVDGVAVLFFFEYFFFFFFNFVVISAFSSICILPAFFVTIMMFQSLSFGTKIDAELRRKTILCLGHYTIEAYRKKTQVGSSVLSI